MKKYLFMFGCIIFCTFSLVGNSSATAIADGIVTVDWNTLSITGGSYSISGGPGGGYIGLNSEAKINQPESNPEYQHNQSPWQSTELNWSLGANTAYLNALPELLTARATSSSSGSGDQNGWINANNHRGYTLLLDPQITYTFSVDYHVEVDLSRDNADQENASNFSQVKSVLNFRVPYGNTLSGAEDADPFNTTLGAGALTNSLLQDGTLTFLATTLSEVEYQQWYEALFPGVPYSEDQLGYYWFETHLHTSSSTSSTFISDQQPPDPVPEPTTMLLLGTGLVGVAGATRRRKTK